MAASTRYPGQTLKIGEGSIEFVRISMQLDNQERARFVRDPRRYFKAFFKAHHLVTNDFIANDRELANLAKYVRASTKPKTAFIVVTAHIRSPTKFRSRRIVVTYPRH